MTIGVNTHQQKSVLSHYLILGHPCQLNHSTRACLESIFLAVKKLATKVVSIQRTINFSLSLPCNNHNHHQTPKNKNKNNTYNTTTSTTIYNNEIITNKNTTTTTTNNNNNDNDNDNDNVIIISFTPLFVAPTATLKLE